MAALVNNFLFCAGAVLPIFLMILLGFLLRRKGLLDAHTSGKMNTLCVRWALPALLFRDLSQADLTAVADPKLLIFAAAAICIEFVLVWAGCALFIKDKKKLGSFAQIGYRSNYVILGMTLLANLYGEGEATAVAAVVSAVAVPLFNAFAVVLLSACGGKKVSAGSLVRGIATNPLIIASVLGIAASFLPFGVPAPLNKAVGYLASCASPIAFLVMGARIEFKGIFDRWSLSVAALRLVIVPLLGMMAAALCGFRDATLMSLFIMFAAPAAVSSYAMATNMGCDERIAANGVFVTTLFSVVTITFGLFIVRALGLA